MSRVLFAGDDTRSLFVPVTFGLLISRDDGASWRWTCEDNIGYSGTFDPTYAIEDDGTIWASTTHGLRVSRDGGCSFELVGAPLGDQFLQDRQVLALVILAGDQRLQLL